MPALARVPALLGAASAVDEMEGESERGKLGMVRLLPVRRRAWIGGEELVRGASSDEGESSGVESSERAESRECVEKGEAAQSEGVSAIEPRVSRPTQAGRTWRGRQA